MSNPLYKMGFSKRLEHLKIKVISLKNKIISIFKCRKETANSKIKANDTNLNSNIEKSMSSKKNSGFTKSFYFRAKGVLKKIFCGIKTSLKYSVIGIVSTFLSIMGGYFTSCILFAIYTFPKLLSS